MLLTWTCAQQVMSSTNGELAEDARVTPSGTHMPLGAPATMGLEEQEEYEETKCCFWKRRRRKARAGGMGRGSAPGRGATGASASPSGRRGDSSRAIHT